MIIKVYWSPEFLITHEKSSEESHITVSNASMQKIKKNYHIPSIGLLRKPIFAATGYSMQNNIFKQLNSCRSRFAIITLAAWHLYQATVEDAEWRYTYLNSRTNLFTVLVQWLITLITEYLVYMKKSINSN